MTTRVDYTSLTGGIDQVSGSVGVKPGMLSDCVNFEQVFGKLGYHRVDGYERFDGRPQPHLAEYWFLPFKNQVAALEVGDAIYGTSGEGVVLDIVYTAENTGYIVYSPTLGQWFADQAIRVGSPVGVVVATASAESSLGRAENSADHWNYLRHARDVRRAVITRVPGEGKVLGVTVFIGSVIAVRNAVGGLTASMWRTTSAGWTLVRSGLRPGGRYEFVTANFSGDTRGMALYGVDGVNPPFKWDGANFTQINSIFGSQATSTTSLAVGTGSKVFSIAGGSRSWQVGDELMIHSANDASHWMRGAVTAYAHPSVTVNVTSTGTAGTAGDWIIGQAGGGDVPYLLAAHKDHLFLAYRRGQLQSSGLGDPMTYGSTASLIGTGDEITSLLSMKGAILGVVCRDKVSLLNGSSKNDWELGLHATNIGSLPYVAQENVGNAILLSERGVMSLQATQNFGSFEPAIWSRNVKPELDELISSIVATRMVRGKYQYRLYFKDGVVMSACIMSPDAMIRPGDVSFTKQRYEHAVSCVGSGDYGGEDGMFFGTEDGWVMREDVGQSFDGEPIEALLRMHFNHLKSPSQKKRFRKIVLEVEARDRIDVRFIQVFDLSDDSYRRSIEHKFGLPGAGGAWDADNWDQFFWSLPMATQMEANVDGVGRNMTLLIWCESDIQESPTISGIITHYSPLGLSR